MDLRALRYFVAVADHGTVTAAAASLHVTQPGLSRQVRALEREWGVLLFNRDSGRLLLTSAGRHLLPQARDLLSRADQLGTLAHHHAGGALLSLTITAPTTTLTDVVAPFLATLLPSDPVPDVWDVGDRGVSEALQQGADLVVSLTPGPPGTESLALPRFLVHAYVPPGHPWTDRTVVDLADLRSVDLIGLRPGSSARHALDLATDISGVAPLTMREAGNGTIAQALCAAGRGVALLSDDPRFGLHQVSVRDYLGAPVGFTLHCSWSSAHPARAALARVAGRIREWVLGVYPEVR